MSLLLKLSRAAAGDAAALIRTGWIRRAVAEGRVVAAMAGLGARPSALAAWAVLRPDTPAAGVAEVYAALCVPGGVVATDLDALAKVAVVFQHRVLLRVEDAAALLDKLAAANDWTGRAAYVLVVSLLLPDRGLSPLFAAARADLARPDSPLWAGLDRFLVSLVSCGQMAQAYTVWSLMVRFKPVEQQDRSTMAALLHAGTHVWRDRSAALVSALLPAVAAEPALAPAVAFAAGVLGMPAALDHLGHVPSPSPDLLASLLVANLRLGNTPGAQAVAARRPPGSVLSPTEFNRLVLMELQSGNMAEAAVRCNNAPVAMLKLACITTMSYAQGLDPVFVANCMQRFADLAHTDPVWDKLAQALYARLARANTTAAMRVFDNSINTECSVDHLKTTRSVARALAPVSPIGLGNTQLRVLYPQMVVPVRAPVATMAAIVRNSRPSEALDRWCLWRMQWEWGWEQEDAETTIRQWKHHSRRQPRTHTNVSHNM